MKKVLFYSLAIAAAITSCTQEAIEAPVNNVQDLSVRPTLGEVVLTEDADLMSRFATGSGAQAKFEENDKLGAAIMDKPLYKNLGEYEDFEKAEDAYDIVNYYSSNSAFTYDGSAWYLNEDQPLVEGNYLFYAPYNAAMQLRTPFVIAVPEKQDASAEKAALDEYYASGAVVKVGYQFLAAENGKAQKPKVSMQDVMAYPKFTIKNNFNGYISKLDKDGKQTKNVEAYTGKLVVDSIKFVNATGEALTIGGALNNDSVAEVLAEKWSVSPMENYTAQLIGEAKTVAKDGVITTLEVGGKELAKGATTSLYAVMPAYKFGKNELAVRIYVTIGDKPYVLQNAKVTYEKSSENGYSVTINSDSRSNLSYTSAVNTVTLIKGQRYPQEELNFEDGKLSTKSSAGNILTLDIKGGTAKSNDVKKVGDTQVTDVVIAQEISVEVEEEELVTDLIDNNTEFIAFFKDQLNGSALSENTTDKIEGTKFAFGKNHTVAINSELIDALFTYNNKGSISITSALPIADDVTVAIEKDVVTFTSANKNAYVITLDANNYTINNGVLMSVIKTNEYASIYVTKAGTWSANNGAIVGNINNYGTVEVPDNVTLEAESFTNNSEATIEVSGNIVNAVTNNGEIVIGASTAVLTVNAGTGSIVMEAANASDNIYVTAAEHTGIYVATELSKKSVTAAEAYSWVNELDVTVADEVEFTEEVLAEIKDITAVHVKDVKFDMGTFDMGGLTLCMDASAAMTITGKTKTQTTVNNVVIKNATQQTVTLKNIAANGTYTGTAKKLATNAATWNGAAIEEGK